MYLRKLTRNVRNILEVDKQLPHHNRRPAVYQPFVTEEVVTQNITRQSERLLWKFFADLKVMTLQYVSYSTANQTNRLQHTFRELPQFT